MATTDHGRPQGGESSEGCVTLSVMAEDYRSLTPSALGQRRAQRLAAQRRRRRRVFAVGILAAVMTLLGAIASTGHRRARPARAAPGLSLERPARAVTGRHRSLAARELAALRRVQGRLDYVASGGRRRREIALTFDDGPGPYTLGVLKVLRRLEAPGTFFQIGFMIPDFPRAEAALSADRHIVLGDHTETHPMLARLSASAQYQQLDDAAGQEQLHARRWPDLFRPPYGSFSAATLTEARRLHMLPVLWSIDSEDYLRPGAAAIVRRVVARARPGAIVLLHDAGGDRSQTIAALPKIIRRLRRRHYRLVTIPRLMLDDPPRGRQKPPASGHG